jgi:pimeloyl-ACP methyl ester carboxylesterase
VHGFFADQCPVGLDVDSAMSGPVDQLSSTGWTGSEDVVSYYDCDSGGDRIASDTTDTSIRRIAKQLAGHIYDRYSSHGQTVDLVAHSMGGLIVRAALYWTQRHSRGFPAKLLVRRVVTFSTPFAGIAAGTASSVPGLSGTYQGTQVITGSRFLTNLGSAAPQGDGGTTWLVIGSSGGCDLVPGSSATALDGATQVLYSGCWSHTQYLVPQPASRLSAVTVDGGTVYRGVAAPLVLMGDFLAAT